MNSRLFLISFLFLFTFSSLQAGNYRPYIGGDLGYGHVFYEHQNADGLSFGLNAGLLINPELAIELGYENLPDLLYSENHYTYAALKGIFPFPSSPLELFGKIGFAAASGLGTTLAAHFGAGATYWFADNLGANLEAKLNNRRGMEAPGMLSTSIGLVYLFH